MARPVSARVIQTFLGLVALLGVLAPGLWAQANVQGQWSTLSGSMPINPIHTALLHNGKILVVAGSGNCPPSMSGCPTGPPYGPANNSGALLFWIRSTGTFTQFTVSWDMFCNGMVVLPDGRAFINGGTHAYDPFFGQPKSSIFDPATNTFTDVQNMAHGRWYPTVTTLGDGRVMTFSGQDENGDTNNDGRDLYRGLGMESRNTLRLGRRRFIPACTCCPTERFSIPDARHDLDAVRSGDADLDATWPRPFTAASEPMALRFCCR